MQRRNMKNYSGEEVTKIIQDCRNEFNLIIEEVVPDNGIDEGKAFDEITRRLNLLIDSKLKEAAWK